MTAALGRPTAPRAWSGALLGAFAALAACGGDERSAIRADAGADAAAPLAAPDARPSAPAPYPKPAYVHLSETGFAFDAAGNVPADLLPFEPTHRLWSDGAEKRRWIRLPPGTQIDTSEMDHWRFPVGTKLWKEFALDGKRLETRLIERYGEGRDDVWMGAFLWNADQTDAVFVPDGADDVLGTAHDVPAAKFCASCHAGEPGRVLGFSALQLSHEGAGTTLASLAARGLLSHPPSAAEPAFAVPGDPVTARALGFLHANCGHCHNPNGISWPDTHMVLRLAATDRVAASTDVVRSVVGQRLQYWKDPGFAFRVVPGDPEHSALYFRMQVRGDRRQMPPLATEIPDPAGLEAVRAWIASLAPPVDAGVPDAAQAEDASRD